MKTQAEIIASALRKIRPQMTSEQALNEAKERLRARELIQTKKGT